MILINIQLLVRLQLTWQKVYIYGGNPIVRDLPLFQLTVYHLFRKHWSRAEGIAALVGNYDLTDK